MLYMPKQYHKMLTFDRFFEFIGVLICTQKQQYYSVCAKIFGIQLCQSINSSTTRLIN